MTEPLSRTDVTAKAMDVVKWLETFNHDDYEFYEQQHAKDALQVIFYLDRVNTALESRLAEIAHTAVQPVVFRPYSVPADSDHLDACPITETQENGDTSPQSEGAVADVDD